MDYDLQIAQKVNEKAKLIGDMEIKKECFLDELTKFTIRWFDETTLSTVKKDGEKFAALGDEKAKELKREIEKLIERSSELVSEYMEKENIWWHEKEDSSLYYPQNNRLLEKQENAIRIMLGELGKILIKYKIVDASAIYTRDYSGGWNYDGQRRLKYAYGITFTEELYKINNEYIKLIEQAQSINNRIKYLQEQRKSENVGEWWQSL
ncbi:hypothetical protein FJQ98_02900 [Lysinibacillus agricola]|uniref:Uncharacterized protein n=1 Tax=Lysinibacillus agricola TaxID=2590012 RepID=A0ABX7AVX8_9BACI|nr:MULTISPECIES: hypothetical protein [Lysinibacillus]KOS61713.1 hypothetical protein AN161_16220 [Lysinibacillus sp. FJAT-14222]QQP13038.1 hypothetical protein FJQ98_02900 [Lysinibacillus agricola]